jgi:hypothetical protein
MIYGSDKVLQATRRRREQITFLLFQLIHMAEKAECCTLIAILPGFASVLHSLFCPVLYVQVLLQTVVSNLSVSNALFFGVCRDFEMGNTFFNSIVLLWEHHKKVSFLLQNANNNTKTA